MNEKEYEEIQKQLEPRKVIKQEGTDHVLIQLKENHSSVRSVLHIWTHPDEKVDRESYPLPFRQLHLMKKKEVQKEDFTSYQNPAWAHPELLVYLIRQQDEDALKILRERFAALVDKVWKIEELERIISKEDWRLEADAILARAIDLYEIAPGTSFARYYKGALRTRALRYVRDFCRRGKPKNEGVANFIGLECLQVSEGKENSNGLDSSQLVMLKIKLEDFFAYLKKNQREKEARALILKAQGYNRKEIADELNTTINSVSTLLSRVRKLYHEFDRVYSQ